MSERSGRVQTVQGLVEPEALGHVQPHEHLLVELLPEALRGAPREPIQLESLGHLRRHWTSNPENLRLDSVEDAMVEMGRYRDAGGGTLVDATCNGIGRDPRGLLHISAQTGVHVVMGSGYYEAVYHPPELETLSVEEIADRIVRDLLEGVDGTGLRSGIIGEIGLGHVQCPGVRHRIPDLAVVQPAAPGGHHAFHAAVLGDIEHVLERKAGDRFIVAQRGGRNAKARSGWAVSLAGRAMTRRAVLRIALRAGGRVRLRSRRFLERRPSVEWRR